MRQNQEEDPIKTEIYRISHSFPPDYRENTKYIAKVHSVFQNSNIEVNVQKVYYRPIYSVQELEEVKRLHQEWFPPNYPEEFYAELFKNQVYRSLLAIYDVQYKNRKMSIILGLITYEYKGIDYSHVQFTFADLCYDRSCMYILTFGVINEVRNKGIGTCLIKELLQTAKADSNISYISLDVVSYNDQARNCYEKNGFINIQTQKNYYEIFGKDYDACVYCYYVNGGKEPRKFTEILLGPISALKKSVGSIKDWGRRTNRKSSDDKTEGKN